MAGVDLSAQFEQIPVQLKFASDQVRAANQRSQEEQAHVTAVHSYAEEAADFAAAAIQQPESPAITAMYLRTHATQINP
jgi:hypothetical protein